MCWLLSNGTDCKSAPARGFTDLLKAEIKPYISNITSYLWQDGIDKQPITANCLNYNVSHNKTSISFSFKTISGQAYDLKCELLYNLCKLVDAKANITQQRSINNLSAGNMERLGGVNRQLGGNQLDPSTIGRNIPLLGGRSTYAGGDNPMTKSGKYSYTYVPTMLTDYPAIGHDRRYDNLETVGFKGLLMDTRAIGADWKFVGEELSIAVNPHIDPTTRTNAGLLGIGLGLIALPKTIIQYANPNGTGHANVMMWYFI